MSSRVVLCLAIALFSCLSIGLLGLLADLRAQEILPAPQLTRGPYLQLLDHDSVEIWWETDLPAAGAVRYQAEGAVEPIEVSAPTSQRQRVLLDGLTPSTRHAYEVLVGEVVAASDEHTHFRTLPPPGTGSFRAIALGDGGVGLPPQEFVADIAEAQEADVFLHTGDLIYFGTPETALFRPYRDLIAKTCLYPSRGNHDSLLARQGIAWRDLFAVPNDAVDRAPRAYYSFDLGPAHFTVLDYYLSIEDDSDQMAFLVDDLRAARDAGARWKIIYLHLPIFSRGAHWDWPHDLDVELPPICDEFGVDLVLSGHDHNFQRTDPVQEFVLRDAWQDPVYVEPRGTVYVVTGGGGASVYREDLRSPVRHYLRTFRAVLHVSVLDISEDRIDLRAITFDDEVVDSFSIVKGVERPPFQLLRGDGNGDGRVDLVDAIAVLGFLFNGTELECIPAVMVRHRTRPLTVTDAVFLLNHLFQAGEPPRPPYPECGEVDPEEDAWCRRTSC